MDEQLKIILRKIMLESLKHYIALAISLKLVSEFASFEEMTILIKDDLSKVNDLMIRDGNNG